eukprot:scaffold132322_cov31-Attheya_sp.AAC.1
MSQKVDAIHAGDLPGTSTDQIPFNNRNQDPMESFHGRHKRGKETHIMCPNHQGTNSRDCKRDDEYGYATT